MMSTKGGLSVKGQWVGNDVKAGNEQGASSEWEVRPCGMLVQKRDPDADAVHAGPLIRIKVSFGRSSHRISIHAHSTFGDLKKLLVQDTGLQTEQQRILYKGKEKSDCEYLHEAGIKDKSKVILVEDSKGWEKKLVEIRKSDANAKACKAVAEVQQLVDQISGKVAAFEAAISSGKKLSEDEIINTSDLLMCQLVKLDDCKVDGDVKVQKRILIRRVQKYVETLDALKLRNDSLRVQSGSPKVWEQTANGRVEASHTRTTMATGRTGSLKVGVDSPKALNNTVVTTTWETFGSSAGSANVKPAPHPSEPLLIQWD